MTLNELFLILGVVLLGAGTVAAFRSSSSGAACSYLGVSALGHSRYAMFDGNLLLFWAVAVLIVLFLGFAKRGFDNYPKLWKNYIVGGALAGMAVGLLYGAAGVSIGAIAGAVLGGLALGRVGRGTLSYRHVWGAVLAVGLPAVVTMTLCGLGVLGLLRNC